MRHRKKRVMELNTGSKKKSIFIRNMLGNLIRSGKLVTTPKRAKVLKAEVDGFFSRLIKINEQYENEKDIKRESIRYVKSMLFGEEEGKKVINKLLPKYLEDGRKKGFVVNYKMGIRKGDGVDKIFVKLV